MADHLIESQLERWKADLGKRLKPSTVKLKVNCARNCIDILGEADLSRVSPDDMGYIDGRLGPSSEANRQRTLRYFGDFLSYAYGINPYEQMLSEAPYERMPRAEPIPYEQQLDNWMDWLMAHGSSRRRAGELKANARKGMEFLLSGEPDLRPSQVDAERVMKVEDDLSVAPDRRNRIANSLARFAEYCGAGPVQMDYHEARSFSTWAKRVFSGKYGKEIRAYYDYMVDYHYRESTCRSQVNAVVYALRIIGQVVGDFELEDLTIEDMRDVRYEQSDVSENTLRTYLTVFGQFCQHTIGSSPYSDKLMMWNEGIDPNRIFLTNEQWAVIVREADPTERIVVVLGSLMGLRKTEMINLRMSDIGQNSVHICGKGHGPRGKEVDKLVDDCTMSFIRAYIEYRKQVLDAYGDRSNGRLIVHDRGDCVGMPFTPESIAAVVRRFSDRLGFRFSCHVFRRFYATALYDDGVDHNMIRIMMRHVRLDTTLNRYINVDSRKIAGAQGRIGDRMAKIMSV